MSGAAQSPRLWHGGAPGRRPGDLLLPPDQTGGEYTRLRMALEEGQKEIAQRHDRVYLTTDKQLAWAFASMWTPDGTQHGGGALYRVEADVLEPDEDLLSLEGVSYQSPQARIVAVYDAHVPFNQNKVAAVFQRVLEDHEAAKRAKE